MDLGQVLRKVALEIYLDVKYMIEEMKKQDRELRTSVMKLFVARTKVKLTQLYLMTRWLSGRNVIDFFHRMNDTGNQMQMINNGLALKLDEMFFSHSAVYAMRTEQLKLSRAADVLIHGGLRNLPVSVFLIGSSSFPVDQVYRITQSDLDLYIKSKFFVSDFNNCSDELSLTASEGVVRIFKPFFFELFLTLQQLSLTSKWNLLGVRILSRVVDSNAGPEDAVPSFSHLEDALLGPCQRILAEQDTWERVVEVCQHTATGASLRLLHISAVKAVNNFWKNTIAVDWKSEEDSNRLVVQFWKSLFSREHLFVLTIKQKRVISSDSFLLLSSLESKSIVYNVRNTLDTGMVTRFEERFNIQQFISSGVDFERLLKACFSHCIEAKLQYIARRLSASLVALSDQSHQVIVGPNSVKLVTIDRQPEVGVIIEVDVRTGRFILDSTPEAGCSLGEWKNSIELFIAEINNVQSEQLFGSFLTKYFTSSADSSISSSSSGASGGNSFEGLTPLLSTVDVILKYLEVNWWSRHLTTTLWKSVASSTAVTTNSSSNPSLSVEISQWGDAEAVRQQCAQNYRKVFLRDSKLPNLQLHTDIVTTATSTTRTAKVTLGLFCDQGGQTRLRIVHPSSESTSASVVLDSQHPTASCTQAVALMEQALAAVSASGGVTQPAGLSGISAGFLQHDSTASTLVLPHESHLYLVYCSEAIPAGGLQSNHCDVSMAPNFHTVISDQWSERHSACQLRLSCYQWPQINTKSVVLEAFKLTGQCISESSHWRSELFIQHLLHASLQSFLRSAGAVATSGMDARGLTVLTLRWWNAMQGFVDALLHILLHPFARRESVNYSIQSVHQSEVGCGTFKALVSVGVSDDVEAYLEVALSNTQWGQLENKSSVSVRNVIAPAASAAVGSSSPEDVKKQIALLIAELHVEE